MGVLGELKSGRNRPLLLFAAVALAVAVLAPTVHDYPEYVDQWSRIASGENPWFEADGTRTNNAYGPVHCLFAPLSAVHEKLPRIVFTGLFLGTAIWFLSRCRPGSEMERTFRIFFLLNPFFWISTIVIGHNDTVPAVLTLFAVHLYRRGRTGGAGGLVALAFLYKIYPAVVVPFLFLHRGRPRWRFLLGFLLTCAIGYLVSWLLWKEHLLYVYQYATARESKVLSIFRVVRGRFSPLPILTGFPDLDWVSVPLLVYLVFVLFVCHAAFRLDSIPSAVLAMVVTFTVYKVGHFQFYAAPFLLLAYWHLTSRDPGGGPRLGRSPALTAYVLWFSLSPAVYFLLDEFLGRFLVLRDVVGLPSFLVQAWLIWVLVGTVRERGSAAGLRAPDGDS
jgi:hypothetical protein